ncbi:nucleoside hydrolase [Shumkonia mesophila]|uniref:nucleoside hydrolase n=1 Tax=Shumkonia mesophila TaxID=2838854 RepID=UPI0029343201|nr:nucleoside hydrolase [Shumkonia mesophila]
MAAIPILIDTDPGVDDAVAILLALASPELEVRAITAVAGNVPLDDTARNARKVCELAGRPDVAVHAGCRKPLLRSQIFGKYASGGGLAGDTLPAPAMPLRPQHAVDVLVFELGRAAHGEAEKITVCTLGPLTNLAVALAHSPHIAKGIEKIVVMGGAFAALGNRSIAAEFNMLADPHAARIVLASGAPVVLVPLDLTFQALATPPRLDAIRSLGNRVGEKVFELLTHIDRSDVERFGVEGGPLHDPTVIGLLLRPDLYRGRPAFVDVECDSPLTLGHTVVDWRGRTGRTPNATVMTAIDSAGFFALLGTRLGRF